MGIVTRIATAALLVASGTCVFADQGLAAYRAMKIKATDVLNGTVLAAQVLPGTEKQVVALVTYFTGSRGDADAVNVRLEVFLRRGEELESVYSRDFGKENGGFVGRGEIEIVDLDGDGVQEIIVSYDLAKDRLIDDRRAEVVTRDGAAFRMVWSGSVRYDATRAAREVPLERRDRYVREIDVPGTRRTKGVSVVFKKTTLSVAGERLPEPKTTVEAFPFRPPSEPG